jgi:hypothetical protein
MQEESQPFRMGKFLSRCQRRGDAFGPSATWGIVPDARWPCLAGSPLAYSPHVGLQFEGDFLNQPPGGCLEHGLGPQQSSGSRAAASSPLECLSVFFQKLQWLVQSAYVHPPDVRWDAQVTK